MVRATINSVKHIVQFTGLNIASLGVSNLALADAVDAPTGSSSTQVRIGSTIKAIYIEMWYLGDGQANTIQTTILEKQPIKTNNPSFAQMGDLHNYNNKNNILYTTEGLVGETDTNPIPALRGWFKIPKGKQRMSQESAIKLSIAAQGVDGLDICGQAQYKEYF